jgi:LL-diaminopimelate aminotransferase
MKRNENISKHVSGYLFPEITKRKKEFLKKNPNAKLISLGIGNTTEPLFPYITNALKKAAEELGTVKGYTGYGDEQGMLELRKKISEVMYNNKISPEEIFISDGAKCDISRLQVMFGPKVNIAVQDPAYPVYIDGSVIIGATGKYKNNKFNKVSYISCDKKNCFFPHPDQLKKTDLIYICSPNNPTGEVATKEQLKDLISHARKKKSIIIFDAAYREYIEDKTLPKSIYEIEGSKEVAIEVNSFSKSIGFTGVRLGWTVVPKELKYDDGELIINDWNRIVTTLFNGASNIVQKGGLAALDKKGLEEMRKTVKYYKDNAKIILNNLKELRIESYGGINSPYIWARFGGKTSWEIFDELLNKIHVVVTPGSGFGSAGEGFVRFSAYGHRKDIEEACNRLKKYLTKN